MGRAPATGNFATRADLCDYVWRTYLGTRANTTDIARQCKVSATVIHHIINGGEGQPDKATRDALAAQRMKGD